eukprot:2349385-Rhodomonas_salina.3
MGRGRRGVAKSAGGGREEAEPDGAGLTDCVEPGEHRVGRRRRGRENHREKERGSERKREGGEKTLNPPLVQPHTVTPPPLTEDLSKLKRCNGWRGRES